MMSYLNTENIARSRDGVEYHPLVPFLPDGAKVLFLGSFPPQRKRWSMEFLEVVEPTDIAALTSQLPQLKAIVTTGEKATETICAFLVPCLSALL